MTRDEAGSALYHETQRLAALTVQLWKRATPNSRKRVRAIARHVRKLDDAWPNDLAAVEALIAESKRKWP